MNHYILSGLKIFITVYILLTSSFSLSQESEFKKLETSKRNISKNEELKSLKITILSTMLTDFYGIGEWGFAALIEINEKKILFDTGARPETVLKNSIELGIDLSQVEDVFLSHNHWDHVGGLLKLRNELSKKNPKAMIRAHVGNGIFLSRPKKSLEMNKMIKIKKEYEATGGQFITYYKPTQFVSNLWFTGPIERVYPERNWSDMSTIKMDKGMFMDYIPEDQAMAINTKNGWIVITGCGHAGIINTMGATKNILDQPFEVAIGGFHLFSASNESIEWTAKKMKKAGLKGFIGAHCTGINPVYLLRELLNLNRNNAIVGTVGTTYDLINGIVVQAIAR